LQVLTVDNYHTGRPILKLIIKSTLGPQTTSSRLTQFNLPTTVLLEHEQQMPCERRYALFANILHTWFY